MDGKQREWTLIVFAVVVSVFIGLFAWYENYEHAGLHSGSAPVFAPTGQIAPGFPESLLLVPSPAVEESYAISYPKANQYTTQMRSSSTISGAISDYLNYFQGNGWTILSKITNRLTAQALYATNASSSVNVAIIAVANGSRVTVSYLTQ